MNLHFASRIALVALAATLGTVGCKKKPEPAPEPPPPAEPQSVAAPAPDAAPPPPGAEATEPAPIEIDYSKMSNEDKYMQEMADSVTTYVQDHVRGKGRMPRDVQDILALKIMDRLEVPPQYVLIIDQRTGKVTYRKKK